MDNFNEEPRLKVVAADFYDNLYDIFPSKYESVTKLTLFGNVWPQDKALNFVNAGINGDGLIANLDSASLTRFK